MLTRLFSFASLGLMYILSHPVDSSPSSCAPSLFPFHSVPIRFAQLPSTFILLTKPHALRYAYYRLVLLALFDIGSTDGQVVTRRTILTLLPIAGLSLRPLHAQFALARLIFPVHVHAIFVNATTHVHRIYIDASDSSQSLNS